MDNPNDFLSMLKISTDSPDRLRPCDVHRVLLTARTAFDDEKFHRFVTWLPTAGVEPRTCEEIDAWLDDEDCLIVWPNFLRDTYELIFSDRDQFESTVALLQAACCQFVIDIGHSSMVIRIHNHDPNEPGSVASILAHAPTQADRLAALGRHPSHSPFAMQRT